MGPRSRRRMGTAGLAAFAVAVLAGGGTVPAQSGAISDYAPATWLPASPSNHGFADRPRSSPVTRIVIHVTNLTFGQTIAKFRDPRAGVSAHYVIRSSDGRVVEMVRERDIAWHAGNRLYNVTSIGIEHEARLSDCTLFSEPMYRSSARLVAHLARRYRIPVDRSHIIGHSDVPDPFRLGRLGGFGHHMDPGPCWDWNAYLALVRASAGTAVASPVSRPEDAVATSLPRESGRRARATPRGVKRSRGDGGRR